MTKAALVALADEVTKDLSQRSAGWSQSFVAQRKYLPKVELSDTDTLHVTVAISGWRKQPDSRSTWAHEFDVDIGIQYRASDKSAEEATDKFDALLLLCQQIGDTYEDTRPTISDCVLTSVEYGGPTGLPYVPQHINELNQFTGVIRLTFTKYR